MQERFYKVFVSSTYEDMKEERQAVFDALLKCNCFPVGMEHFPSSNWRSADLIKRYIDQCDYYVLISGGVYGSMVPDVHPEISYVEWEYDYARERMPCYSFLVEDCGKLIGDRLEKKHSDLLANFHVKVKSSKNIKFYKSPVDLGASVLHAFQHAPKDSPRPGWTRGGQDLVERSDDILVGAWKLVRSNSPDWNSSTVIKVFSKNEFLWLKIDSNGNRSFILGRYKTTEQYGSYGAYGGTVLQEVPVATNYDAIKNRLQEYEMQIDDSGTILTTSGDRSTGGYFEEQFERIDLSSGTPW